MLNASDTSVLLAAMVGFIFFLLFHVPALRTFSKIGTARVILYCLVAGLVASGIAFYFMVSSQLELGVYSLPALILAGMLSAAIYIFFVFHYIAFGFGMGEASVRIGLLSRLYLKPLRGASLKDIYEEYNVDRILDTRLFRLVNSGHLQCEDRFYRVRNRILWCEMWFQRFLKRLFAIS